MSRLDLVVGPNGAGKTTFVTRVLGPQRPGVPFVNADVIAAQRWPTDPMRHARDAAEVAAATRTALIGARRPFIAETVFSHPSKLDLVDQARAAGFYVAVHVVMIPVALAPARVQRRVASGGHDVPTDRILGRYERLWPLVAEAVGRADTGRFWDNSRLEGPELVAVTYLGEAVGALRWPPWTPEVLRRRWAG